MARKTSEVSDGQVCATLSHVHMIPGSPSQAHDTDTPTELLELAVSNTSGNHLGGFVTGVSDHPASQASADVVWASPDQHEGNDLTRHNNVNKAKQDDGWERGNSTSGTAEKVGFINESVSGAADERQGEYRLNISDLIHGSAHGTSEVLSMSMKVMAGVLPRIERFTQQPAALVDTYMHSFRCKMARESLSAVFTTSSPLSTLLSKTGVQILLLVAGITSLALMSRTVQTLSSPKLTVALRFVPKELRSGTKAIDMPPITDFGILAAGDGCAVPVRPSVLKFEDAHAIADYQDEPQQFAGFYFVTQNASARSDPVKFVVRAQFEGGGDWEDVAYSSWRLGSKGELGWREEAFDTPTGRGQTVRVNMRDWRWFWYAGTYGADAIQGVMLVLTAVLGWFGREQVAKHFLLGGGSLRGACFIVAGAGYLVHGDSLYAANLFLKGLDICAIACLLQFREEHFFRIVLGGGVCLFVMEAVFGTQMFGSIRHGATMSSIILIVVGLSFNVFYLCVNNEVSKIVEQDKATYQALWDTVVANEANAHHLRRLQALTDQIRTILCRGRHARHFHTRNVVEENSSPLFSGNRSIAKKEQEGWSQPWLYAIQRRGSVREVAADDVSRITIKSLDQIFGQAVCLEPFLRTKAQVWALKSGGMFQSLTMGKEFVSLEEVQEDSFPEEAIAWQSCLKRRHRAIEKVLRLYGDDPSRLVDVCRQTIVFEDVEDIVKCLEAMHSDKDIVICRIKNRMEIGYDGEASAGFRHVCVNVRIVGQQTRRFGVDSHVAEVQLVLKQFALLNDEERHDRYVVFRSFRRPRPARGVMKHILPLLARTLSWRPPISESSDQPHDLSESFMANTNNFSAVSNRATASAVVQMLHWRNTTTRGPLDSVANRTTALPGVNLASILFIRHPVAGGLSKRPLRRALLLLALVALVLDTLTLVKFWSAAPAFSRFRFTALETRSGKEPHSPGIAAFRVMQGGCLVQETVALTSVSGPTMEVVYSSPVRIDGIQLTTQTLPDRDDPVRFEVEASNAGGSEWDLVGASGWRSTKLGMVHSHRYKVSITAARGATEEVEMRGLDQLLELIASMLLELSILLACVRAAGADGNVFQNAVLAAGCASASIVKVLQGAMLLHITGIVGHFLAELAQAMVPAGLAVTLLVAPHNLVLVGSVLGLVGVVLRVLLDTVVLHNPGALWYDPPLTAACTLVFGSLALVLRAFVLARSRQLMEAYRIQYEKAWEHVKSSSTLVSHSDTDKTIVAIQQMITAGKGQARQLMQKQRKGLERPKSITSEVMQSFRRLTSAGSKSQWDQVSHSGDSLSDHQSVVGEEAKSIRSGRHNPLSRAGIMQRLHKMRGDSGSTAQSRDSQRSSCAPSREWPRELDERDNSPESPVVSNRHRSGFSVAGLFTRLRSQKHSPAEPGGGARQSDSEAHHDESETASHAVSSELLNEGTNFFHSSSKLSRLSSDDNVEPQLLPIPQRCDPVRSGESMMLQSDQKHQAPSEHSPVTLSNTPMRHHIVDGAQLAREWTGQLSSREFSSCAHTITRTRTASSAEDSYVSRAPSSATRTDSFASREPTSVTRFRLSSSELHEWDAGGACSHGQIQEDIPHGGAEGASLTPVGGGARAQAILEAPPTLASSSLVFDTSPAHGQLLRCASGPEPHTLSASLSSVRDDAPAGAGVYGGFSPALRRARERGRRSPLSRARPPRAASAEPLQRPHSCERSPVASWRSSNLYLKSWTQGTSQAVSSDHDSRPAGFRQGAASEEGEGISGVAWRDGRLCSEGVSGEASVLGARPGSVRSLRSGGSGTMARLWSVGKSIGSFRRRKGGSRRWNEHGTARDVLRRKYDVMRGLDRRRPVRSLDQLYAQAICLAPMLLAKVQEWALQSGGLFFTQDGGFIQWAEALDDPDKQASIRWPSLKRQERAIEKVLRAYGEDVSLLVDVCRQSIVFESMADLLQCLEVIFQDESVVLMRLKNRLCVQYDGAESAGFRNLSLNMRLVDEEAHRFGLETHVCELQLLLRPFAELLKTEGHKQYVEFRNIRGE